MVSLCICALGGWLLDYNCNYMGGFREACMHVGVFLVFWFECREFNVLVFECLLVAFEPAACWMSGGDSIWLSAG